MDTIGLDLHKRESQLCELTEAGKIVERRIVTSRERFTAVLGDRTSARILLEPSTADLARAVAKRFTNGTPAAAPEAPTQGPANVSSSAAAPTR